MINGDRVRQVRELKGMTQTEFANNIGVTQPDIAQIESGRIAPGEEVLQRIILLTGFPLSFFKQPPSVDFPLGSLLFRARQSTTLRERSEARQYARTIFELVENLEKDVEKIPLYLPRLDDSPRDAAMKTRAALGLSPDQPIDNLINILERNGILVMALPVNIDKADAFSAWVGLDQKRPVVTITNRNVSGDRLRFSIAHELGHLVIHQAAVGSLKKIDKEADEFAGEFLMPKEAMLKEIVTPVTLLNLMHMKSRWKVSIQALMRCSYDLQLITDRQYRYLYQQLCTKYSKTKEPIDIKMEKPRLIGQITEMLFGIPINYKQLALRANLPQRIVKDIVEAHAVKNGSQGDNGQKSANGCVIKFDPKKSV